MEDRCSVRVLGAQKTNSLHQVIYHFVHVIREARYITRTHDELSEHAPHPQPIFSFTGKTGSRGRDEVLAFPCIVRHMEEMALFLIKIYSSDTV